MRGVACSRPFSIGGVNILQMSMRYDRMMKPL
jgi:hypothetical protein